MASEVRTMKAILYLFLLTQSVQCIANITTKVGNNSNITLSQSETRFQQFFQIQEDVGTANHDAFYGIISIFYRNKTKEIVRKRILSLEGDILSDDPAFLYQLSYWRNTNSYTSVFEARVHYTNKTEVKMVRVELNYIFGPQMMKRKVYYTDVRFEHTPLSATSSDMATSSDREKGVTQQQETCKDKQGGNFSVDEILPIVFAAVFGAVTVVLGAVCVILLRKARNKRIHDSPDKQSNDHNNTLEIDSVPGDAAV